jgi:hypothetical protein
VWQRSIIELLKENGASQEHIKAVESQIGAIRYRPEDVAGAAASDRLPAEFATTERLARAILEKLQSKGLSLS